LSGREGEQAVASAPVPACMDVLLRGYEWARNTVGEAGAAVYRLHRAGSAGLYLKVGYGAVAGDITDELVRLRWLADRVTLAGRTGVPEVRHFVASDHAAWLLIKELPGETARRSLQDSGADRFAIVDALATFLQQFHAVPIESCPFNSDHRLRVIQARERLAAGLVDSADFDRERAGWTAAQVWDEMIGSLPLTTDPVVTHGDFSLDNILMEGGEVVGIIDVARAGVADRYQDLAVLSNGLREFGDTLSERLFKRYGIAVPDQRKLRFHAALDEFF